MSTLKGKSRLLRPLIVMVVALSLNISKAEHFEGKAKSFGFDIAATGGATSISMKNPEPSIKTSGGNFKYEKVDAQLGPMFANNVVAMVEAKGAKMNVEGDYPKWKPKVVKIIPKKRIIKVKMLPLLRPISIKTLEIKEKKTTRNYAKKKQIQEKDPSYKTEDAKIAQHLINHVNAVGKATRKLHNVLLHKPFPIIRKRRHYFATSQKSKRAEESKRIDDLNENAEKAEARNSGMQHYASGMKTKVNHVINEAKQVLLTTGKVVRGLKRVIGGAKKLTEFADNAVKFAKYFTMEPSNATVDYFEEKAVIAVLEAQKAAAEAKLEALVAKEAAKNAREVLNKIKRAKNHQNQRLSEQISKAAKYVESQSQKAKFAAKKTSEMQREAKSSAIVVDKALRKMVESIETQNEKLKNKANLKNEESDVGSGQQIEEEVGSGEKMKIKDVNDRSLIKKTAAEGTNAIEPGSSTEEDENEDKESGDAKDLYENIKTELGKATANNYTHGNESITQANDSLNQDSLENGGDENEVIANDFKKEGEKIKGNSTKPGILEERVSEINKGPLNLIVTVKRKQLQSGKQNQTIEPNLTTKDNGKDSVIDDPFNFKEMLELNENSDGSIADPFVFISSPRKSNIRSMIPKGEDNFFLNAEELKNKKLKLAEDRLIQNSAARRSRIYSETEKDNDFHQERSFIPPAYNQYEYIGNRKTIPNYVLPRFD